MQTYSVKIIYAHNGETGWVKHNVKADGPEDACECALSEWMPCRPVTLLVWVTRDMDQMVRRFEIGLN